MCSQISHIFDVSCHDVLSTSAGFVLTDNEGTSAVHMSYTDRLRLSALTKQVTHGKYSSDIAPSVGLLDVFGNDQRYHTLLLLHFVASVL